MVQTSTAHVRHRLTARLLRPLLRVVVRRYLRQQSRPSYDDRAVAGGPHPIRVLVVGAGLAVGYGGGRDGASLPQQIARGLVAELSRGAIVESRAQAAIPLERIVEQLGMSGAATFDVVVWSPTLDETFRGDTRAWARELRRVVASVAASGKPQVRVVLMGVPGVEGDHPLQRAGAVLAAEMNARIERVAAESGRTVYLPVPPRRIDARDTPLFDPAYQRHVVGSLVALLGDEQRRAAEDSSAAFRASASERTTRRGMP